MELDINKNRITLDEAYLQMVEIWAKRSKANRRQVGAFIVKNSQIISDGYNGMPSGSEDEGCETISVMGDAGMWLDPETIAKQWPFESAKGRYTLVTKPSVLHAESNALMKLCRYGSMGSDGATLYVTLSPCIDCSKLIKQAMIKRVVFREMYRDSTGIDFLKSYNIEVVHLPTRELINA